MFNPSGLDKLPNPFRKEEPAQRKPPEKAGPREWARLYVMAMVLCMCIGMMIYTKKLATPRAKKGEKPGPEQIDYKIQDQIRKKPDAGAEEAARQEDPEKPRKEVPIQPLPKDGIVDFKELARPFQDGQDKPVKESPEFINLLNVFMNAVTPESLSQRVNPEVTADQAYLDPAKHRGEVIRAYGRLIYIYTERLECTTPNNIEYVYLGVLQSWPRNRTVYFYMADKPKDPKTGEPIKFKTYERRGHTFYDDWVEVEGTFLRTYDYPGQRWNDEDREPLVRSSLMFVKNLRLSSRPQMTDSRSGFIVAVSIIAAVVVAIVIVAGIMSRRYGKESMRQKMFDVRRSKAREKGEDLFPKPTPSKPVLGDQIPKPASTATPAAGDPSGPPAAPP